MRTWAIIFLCLLSKIASSQAVQTIMLCPSARTEYKYFIEGQLDNLTWTTPTGEYSSPSVLIDWQDTGRYTLSVEYIDLNSCNYAKRTMQINVLPCSESSIWIPSAFTPNDDRLNDFFDIKGYNIVYYKLLIFNRWGQEIFVSDALDLDWDGTYLNNPVQEDVYVYSVKWQGILGKWGSRIGSVTLIR